MTLGQQGGMTAGLHAGRHYPLHRHATCMFSIPSFAASCLLMTRHACRAFVCIGISSKLEFTSNGNDACKTYLRTAGAVLHL